MDSMVWQREEAYRMLLRWVEQSIGVFSNTAQVPAMLPHALLALRRKNPPAPINDFLEKIGKNRGSAALRLFMSALVEGSAM
jgi:hypothetical protein